MKNKHIQKYWHYVVMYLIASLSTILASYMFSYLIDEIIGKSHYDNLVIWGVLALVLSIVSSLLSFYFIKYSELKLSVENHEILSTIVLKNILTMKAKFYQTKEKAYYYNILTNSTAIYADVDVQIHFIAFAIILLIMIMSCILFFIQPILLFMFIIFIFLIFIVSYSQSKKLANLQRTAMEKQDIFLGDLKNIVDYKREINVLHVTNFFVKQYEKSIESWIAYIKKYKFHETFTTHIPIIITSIFTVIYLFFGSFMIKSSIISIGILLFGYQCLSYISGPASILCYIIIRFQANKEHYCRIDELETQQKDLDFDELLINENQLLSADTLKVYADNRAQHLLYTFDHQSMPLGNFIIIKGANGTGKSMLLNILSGIIDSNFARGNFAIYKNIKDSAYLTYPHIFINGTFDDNMFGIIPNQEILKLLNIDFSNKIIKTNPINLSLGQQQKISLLRVLSQNKQILFLDEPFTNLDVKTQENVRQYLIQIKSMKTIVLILHDETLDDVADNIFLIKNKNIFEIS